MSEAKQVQLFERGEVVKKRQVVLVEYEYAYVEEYDEEATIEAQEALLEALEHESGHHVWDVIRVLEKAAKSWVDADAVNAFIAASAIHKHLPLVSDYDIEKLLHRLDLAEGSCGYFAFSHMSGGVDPDCMSAHGRTCCYGDYETDAIYGLGKRGYLDEVLLVSAEACEVLDEVFDCVCQLASTMPETLERALEDVYEVRITKKRVGPPRVTTLG